MMQFSCTDREWDLDIPAGFAVRVLQNWVVLINLQDGTVKYYNRDLIQAIDAAVGDNFYFVESVSLTDVRNLVFEYRHNLKVTV